MWQELATTLEDFLFTENISSGELPIEAIQKDEMIDCQLIELIRDDILAHSGQLPRAFIRRILDILNRGSIYSNSFETFLDLDSSRRLREEFSKICFETLLRYSFLHGSDAKDESSLNRMALNSMLDRCKEIIQRYAHDERLNGNIPLARLLVIGFESKVGDAEEDVSITYSDILAWVSVGFGFGFGFGFWVWTQTQTQKNIIIRTYI